MKKPTAMFLSFSALLTLSAFAPHVFWQADKTNRFPASAEAEAIPAAKPVAVEAQVECSKDKQPKDLELEVKKLMLDKESILKELAELKKSKNEVKVEEAKELKDEKKEVKKEEKVVKNEDILNIMTQLTSMMATQHQQQMSMMTQMFSMYQPRQMSSWYSPMSDYMSPYAFNASNFQYPGVNSLSTFSADGSGVGLGYNSYGNYGYGLNSSGVYGQSMSSRIPAQIENQMMFDRGSFVESESFQPKVLTEKDRVPHNGYDFRTGFEANNITRTQF